MTPSAARPRLSIESGNWHWYGAGAYMGLVADTGWEKNHTFTGWTLKDSGSGNQANFLTGVAYNLGPFQFAPNFLWQKPIVGAGPSNSGLPARNVLQDPFAVRGNRETIAGEMLIAFDPTPGTWMWQWDNAAREDGFLTASLDFAFRYQPTSSDASTYIPSGTLERVPFAFGWARPPTCGNSRFAWWDRPTPTSGTPGRSTAGSSRPWARARAS